MEYLECGRNLPIYKETRHSNVSAKMKSGAAMGLTWGVHLMRLCEMLPHRHFSNFTG